MLEWWANRRTIVRLVAEVVRLVTEVVGDRKWQISRNKVDDHVQTWNLLYQIVSGRTISRATGRATLRPVVPPIGCSLTLYNVEMFLGFRSLPIQRPTLLFIRSIVGGHDRSYDRSFMTTTSRTIFSKRCWSRDHAYDQSYGDLPPGRKTDRSMRSLLAIVANNADRSHVRHIATDRTIKQSYDPVWQWL